LRGGTLAICGDVLGKRGLDAPAVILVGMEPRFGERPNEVAAVRAHCEDDL
jgi:hypothetical protein